MYDSQTALIANYINPIIGDMAVSYTHLDVYKRQCQYTATYLGTYDESARRRIGLAEKLRTLPLTFFHPVSYTHLYYTDPKYVLLSLAVTAILAVLGCMISNKLIVKHFRKSGAIK